MALLRPELLKVLLRFLSPSECNVGVHQGLGTLSTSAPQLGFVVQQDLPLGHSADVGCAAVSPGDEGGIDVSPARTFSAAFSARIRLNTLRT
ncbi:hypothetical protein D3C84_982560 [compost metagenome]